jgi:hypothetical protein
MKRSEDKVRIPEQKDILQSDLKKINSFIHKYRDKALTKSPMVSEDLYKLDFSDSFWEERRAFTWESFIKSYSYTLAAAKAFAHHASFKTALKSSLSDYAEAEPEMARRAFLKDYVKSSGEEALLAILKSLLSPEYEPPMEPNPALIVDYLFVIYLFFELGSREKNVHVSTILRMDLSMAKTHGLSNYGMGHMKPDFDARLSRTLKSGQGQVEAENKRRETLAKSLAEHFSTDSDTVIINKNEFCKILSSLFPGAEHTPRHASTIKKYKEAMEEEFGKKIAWKRAKKA